MATSRAKGMCLCHLCAHCIAPSCPCNQGIRHTEEQLLPKITPCSLLPRQMGSMGKQSSSSFCASHECLELDDFLVQPNLFCVSVEHGAGFTEQCGKCMHNVFRDEVYCGYSLQLWENPSKHIARLIPKRCL